MSKGNRIFAVRVDNVLLELIDETIQRRNTWTRGIPWTFSDFVRVAVLEKAKKMKRSRRPRAPRHKGTVWGSGSPLPLAGAGAPA